MCMGPSLPFFLFHLRLCSEPLLSDSSGLPIYHLDRLGGQHIDTGISADTEILSDNVTHLFVHTFVSVMEQLHSHLWISLLQTVQVGELAVGHNPGLDMVKKKKKY